MRRRRLRLDRRHRWEWQKERAGYYWYRCRACRQWARGETELEAITRRAFIPRIIADMYQRTPLLVSSVAVKP